ncbi:RNA polymerase factor sigma-54 [Methylobrevis albus]|uniref:RNA polymerase sigma-54 factor n=1 Tax=Methylobrevis albus TaxID=2793297 RepID=A0A931I3B2_9HYPH|nr:RNA polymerase factor sigma-54 [Methylobrevis albus]MBH0238679.1 RNA polymerase factor sigma-54 [Methylobrevis albus]
MALSARLELRQSQSLVMTPQLMQAIKLLQLSNLDLVAYVDAELERNPLLERVDSEGAPDRDEFGREGEPREAPAAEAAGETGFEGDFEAGVDGGSDWMATDGPPTVDAVSSVLDTDIGNVYPDDTGSERNAGLDAGQLSGDSWSSSSRGNGGEDYNLEAFVAGETTLHDHLSAQLTLAIADPVRRLIGQELIDAVDEAGYLRVEVPVLAERLGADPAEIEAVIAILHGFEPAGICARTLAECLALQLKERDRLDPAMKALLAHIELLARRDLAQLKRICGVDDDDLADMIREILALNPKPGNAFGHTVIQPVVPDVVVKPASDGGWSIELNTETLPRVLVNQVYYAKVSKTTRDDGEKAYLSECLQTANWLVKSLDQRARTILKVSTEIVRQQDAFLTHGVQHLRPLNLRMIAEAIGMHESTVSRVTSNKYMATTRGIFELKYFFTSSIASAEGGDAHSAEAVRWRIKQMIDAEDPDDVVSDDAIVKLLRDAGVDIARRTVAKYREAMRIPSSVQRRRQKQSL